MEGFEFLIIKHFAIILRMKLIKICIWSQIHCTISGIEGKEESLS